MTPKLFRWSLYLLLVLGTGSTLHIWNTALRPNSLAVDGRFVVDANVPAEGVVQQLVEQGRLQNPESLLRYLSWRGWMEEGSLRQGRYLIPDQLDNRTLARLLRSGSREAAMVRFVSVRRPENLAGAVAHQMALDSTDLVLALKDPLLAARHGVNTESLRTRFIPNTYQVWYDLDATDFVARMVTEWERWWTEERRNKAKKLNLTPTEVGILASIVKAETSKMDEAPIVAGLYVNRIRKGMRLQADPTLLYVLDDPTIRRVLNVHREIDSPYNTYKNSGLPPGPINYPEPAYLDAVLNAKKHEFIFMCAREDFSGYHAFAKTNREHERNARRYRRALDRQGVYR